MSVKIAITGANGFIGSRLTLYLMKNGYEVTAIIRSTAKVHLLPVKSRFREIDYGNPDSIQEALHNHDIIIHSAALTKARNWNEMLSVNLGLTEKVIQAANDSPSVKQVIFLSSQAAAGMSSSKNPVKESDACKPVTWYGKSKLLAEQFIQEKCRKDWTIVRPCSVYGPGDSEFLQIFRYMKRHFSISLGWREKYLNLIYIDELTQFLENCFFNPKAYNQIFYATDGKIYTHKDFLDALQQAVQTFSLNIAVPDTLVFSVALLTELKNLVLPGNQNTINLQKFRELSGKYWLCSIDKAKELLDYNPQPDLAGNLYRTWMWYKEQNWL